MITEVLLGVLGFAASMFLPGYLLLELLMPNERTATKTYLGMSLSILITMIIGVMLGYNESVAATTGGVTPLNVWIYSLVVLAILGTLLAFVRMGISVPMPSQRTRRKIKSALQLTTLERSKEEHETEAFLVPAPSEDGTPEFIIHRDINYRRQR